MVFDRTQGKYISNKKVGRLGLEPVTFRTAPTLYRLRHEPTLIYFAISNNSEFGYDKAHPNSTFFHGVQVRSGFTF